jgi:hypothetical protein
MLYSMPSPFAAADSVHNPAASETGRVKKLLSGVSGSFYLFFLCRFYSNRAKVALSTTLFVLFALKGVSAKKGPKTYLGKFHSCIFFKMPVSGRCEHES